MQNRAAIVVLFAPAFFTILFTLLGPYQNLVIQDFSNLDVLGLSAVTYQGGAWFPVHYLSSVVITFMAFGLGAQVFRRGSAVQRKQIVVLMAGSFASLACDVYCVITKSPLRWAMLPAGTYLITEGAIAYGVFQYRFLAAAVSDFFSTISALVNVAYKINGEWNVQGSVGVQNWSCEDCETKVAFGGMVKKAVVIDSTPWIRDVWLQYLSVAQDPVAHEALLGVTIQP